MRILFACGGTAGHINPALAVAGHIMAERPGTVIEFVGNPDGMEAKLVPAAGYAFAPIQVLGIQRRLNMRNIKNNVKAAWYLAESGPKAAKIIKDFAPDVVFGTGGYVSGPILRKAAQLGFHTIAMENNAYPGLTTKLLAKYVDKILLVVGECRKYLPDGKKYIVTGNPVRDDILTADRAASRGFYNVGDRICIVSFGGSLGAQRLNEAVADLMAWHIKEKKNFLHIHASGSYYGPDEYKHMLTERGVDYSGNSSLVLKKYINDMPRCLAAADLVISRAGAMTLTELEAAGRASVLIPSPNVAENHQYHNAMVLQNHGAAVVIEEKNLTGKLLCETVDKLTGDREKLSELGKNARKLAVLDANDRICAEIYSSAAGK